MAAGRHQSIDRARQDLGLSANELWTDYLGLGGMVLLPEVEAYLSGAGALSGSEVDVLVQAINERLMDRHGQERLPFSDELP